MFIKSNKFYGYLFLVSLLLSSNLSSCAKGSPTNKIEPTNTPKSTQLHFPTDVSSTQSDITNTPVETQLASQAIQRGVWVWQNQVVTNTKMREDFLDFARNKNISVAYIYAFGLLPQEDATLQDFLKKADFQVELLAGDPSWALSEKHSQVLSFTRDVLNLSQESETKSNLVGVHLDIEPYLLPGWESDQLSIINQYLTLLESVHDILVESNLLLTVDIPFWFDSINVEYNGYTLPLSQHTQNLTDQIVLMDYRDVANGDDGIIQHAAEEINYAIKINRQVIIGVETINVSPDPEKITFFEEGEQAMETELTNVIEFYADNPAFAGIAIHDYLGYRNLSKSTKVESATMTPSRTLATLPPDASQSNTMTPDQFTCKPNGGIVEPSLCIASTFVRINDGIPQYIGFNGTLSLSAGDTLKLASIHYCASGQELSNSVTAEGYLFENNLEAYDKGIYSSDGVPINNGCHDLENFVGAWVVNSGQHRVVITLIHYFDDQLEVDDRFYVHLDVKP